MSFSVYNDYIIAGEEISTSPIITSNLTAGTSITTRRIISSDSTGQVSIGYGASTVGTSSVAIGLNTGGGINSVSIGAEANINNATYTVAIGYQAGQSNNAGSNVCIGHQAGVDGTGLKTQTVTIGNLAGYYGVETKSVAIGHGSGYSGLGTESVAIGYYAGASGSKTKNVAIGYQAGYTGQGINSIAIGYQAGYANQHDNSIILNALGSPFTTNTQSAFFVKPIRSGASGGTDKVLRWNSSSGEVYIDSSKTFVINHPLDKEKYLVHGCLEGPEAGVYYRGQSEITNNDSVEVILPEYTKSFSQFTVQVTGIYNNNKIINYNTCQVEDGKFMVYGRNGRFFWLVHALRVPINVEPLKSETVVKGDGPYKYIV
jgi:hypothetical protein